MLAQCNSHVHVAVLLHFIELVNALVGLFKQRRLSDALVGIQANYVGKSS